VLAHRAAGLGQALGELGVQQAAALLVQEGGEELDLRLLDLLSSSWSGTVGVAPLRALIRRRPGSRAARSERTRPAAVGRPAASMSSIRLRSSQVRVTELGLLLSACATERMLRSLIWP
jgi:hypothetical protein